MKIRQLNHTAILFLVIVAFAAFVSKVQANLKSENFCAELKKKKSDCFI